MKKIDEYELIIWDLDGTLYYQSPFRKKMLLVLLKGLILKPWKWQEFYIIWQYRKIREKWDAQDSGEDLTSRQYEKTGKLCRCSSEKVKSVIEYWMLNVPNVYLIDYLDTYAAEWIRKLQLLNKKVVVWSDYPVEDKLKVLRIKVTDSICSTDKIVGAMKPNPKGIQVLLERYQIAKENALMIGDREEKDALAAKEAGIDWMILSKNRKQRELQYKMWQ